MPALLAAVDDALECFYPLFSFSRWHCLKMANSDFGHLRNNLGPGSFFLGHDYLTVGRQLKTISMRETRAIGLSA